MQRGHKQTCILSQLSISRFNYDTDGWSATMKAGVFLWNKLDYEKWEKRLRHRVKLFPAAHLKTLGGHMYMIAYTPRDDPSAHVCCAGHR